MSVPRSTPEKQLAAWLFIRWFSEPRQQAQWTHVSLYFPVRKAAEPLIRDLLDADANFAAAWTMLKTAHLRSEPPFAGYDLVRDAVSAAYNRVLDGADVDRALAALQAQGEKIYRDAAP
jgi:ABC-type glycerol-3-phosphate transport system substrate-binding protein